MTGNTVKNRSTVWLQDVNRKFKTANTISSKIKSTPHAVCRVQLRSCSCAWAISLELRAITTKSEVTGRERSSFFTTSMLFIVPTIVS